MKLPPELLEILAKGSLKDTYEWAYSITQDDNTQLETIQKIIHGIQLKFDIHYIIYKHHHIRDRAGEVSIHNKTYKIEDYWKEMDNRKALIKKIILTSTQDTIPHPRRT